MTEFLFAAIGGKGKIVRFFHSAHPGVRQREIALDDALKASPGITEVANHYVQVPGQIDDSRAAMDAILLANPGDGAITGVWAAWDEPGIGALALARRGQPRAASSSPASTATRRRSRLIKGCTPFIGTVRQGFGEMSKIAASELNKVLAGGNACEARALRPGRAHHPRQPRGGLPIELPDVGGSSVVTTTMGEGRPGRSAGAKGAVLIRPAETVHARVHRVSASHPAVQARAARARDDEARSMRHPTRPAMTAAFLQRYGTLLAFIAACRRLLDRRAGRLRHQRQPLNLLQQITTLSIVAVAATFVMVIGEFDLSVGFVASLAAVIAFVLLGDGSAILVADRGGPRLGHRRRGWSNGVLVARYGVPSFVATLAVGTIVSGLAYWVSGGSSLFSGIPAAYTALGRGADPRRAGAGAVDGAGARRIAGSCSPAPATAAACTPSATMPRAAHLAGLPRVPRPGRHLRRRRRPLGARRPAARRPPRQRPAHHGRGPPASRLCRGLRRHDRVAERHAQYRRHLPRRRHRRGHRQRPHHRRRRALRPEDRHRRDHHRRGARPPLRNGAGHDRAGARPRRRHLGAEGGAVRRTGDDRRQRRGRLRRRRPAPHRQSVDAWWEAAREAIAGLGATARRRDRADRDDGEPDRRSMLPGRPVLDAILYSDPCGAAALESFAPSARRRSAPAQFSAIRPSR